MSLSLTVWILEQIGYLAVKVTTPYTLQVGEFTVRRSIALVPTNNRSKQLALNMEIRSGDLLELILPTIQISMA